eukprot:snap_masked-scaffold_78-processed-gene-0.27-mRNA-1 protein AED:1.00 eAED:1.00 QI:0/0/0/0/1/1/2/0/71
MYCNPGISLQQHLFPKSKAKEYFMVQPPFIQNNTVTETFSSLGVSLLHKLGDSTDSLRIYSNNAAFGLDNT